MDMIINADGKNLSKREYGIISDRYVSVPVRDGVKIDVDVFRPDSKGKFPALLGMSPLHKEFQRDRIWPAPSRTSRVRGTPTMDLEAGATDFYVRRGYVHIIGSARGTGRSGGAYRYRDSKEISDVYDVIEWAAKQPWCNGNVSMLGIAYFAAQQIPVAIMQPPHLKCIAPMFPFWDDYRHFWWPGGVLTSGFLRWFCSLVNMDIHTAESVLREELGEKGFKEAIARALEDKDISADPALVDALKHPDEPGNIALLDILLHPTDTPYWRSRQILDLDSIKVPAYIGVSGHRFGPLYHLSEMKITKKVVACPPAYVDKPFYQFAWELLRWYDHWLKGIPASWMSRPSGSLSRGRTNG
jgi:putative CocE/NonD family hydrolase